jgi:hypothetical protein
MAKRKAKVADLKPVSAWGYVSSKGLWKYTMSWQDKLASNAIRVMIVPMAQYRRLLRSKRK